MYNSMTKHENIYSDGQKTRLAKTCLWIKEREKNIKNLKSTNKAEVYYFCVHTCIRYI